MGGGARLCLFSQQRQSGLTYWDTDNWSNWTTSHPGNPLFPLLFDVLAPSRVAKRGNAFTIFTFPEDSKTSWTSPLEMKLIILHLLISPEVMLL